MSCFFCNSNNHVSHNCDVHKSDESRQQIAASKNYCPTCVAPPKTIFSLKINCKCKLRCFICFFKDHSTVYCPERFTVSCTAPPNIDNVLLCRFVKLLKFEEKHALALTNPSIFRFANLKLKVYYQKEMTFPTDINFTNTDVIVADFIFVRNHDQRNLGLQTSVIFRIRYLDINVIHISAQELLLLLSSQTKVLKCKNTTFYPNLQFSAIIKKAPKLEEINLSSTNIVMNKSWPDDLVQFNTAEALQSLNVRISDDEHLNVESIAELFKKESAKYLKIILSMDIKYDAQYANVKRKLSEYFISGNFLTGQFLQLLSRSTKYRRIVNEEYVLKNF